MAKKEDIKNGNDITLDDGNITVLQGTEFSKEKEVEKAEVAVDVPVSEEITPDVKVDNNEESQPTIDVTKSEEPQNKVSNVPKIDLGGIDLDALSSSLETPVSGAHSINNDIPTPISTNQDFNAPIFNESSTFGVSQQPSYVNAGDHSSEFAHQPSANVTDDIEGNSIFKTTQEVDKAMDSIMDDIKKSYSDKMAEPTKTLVEFVNKFVKWGNEVTANGLNRRLFDEYDELIAMLNKKKSTDNNLNGIDTTLGNQNTTSKDSTNEYGDLNGINFNQNSYSQAPDSSTNFSM
mgnify:FL=1